MPGNEKLQLLLPDHGFSHWCWMHNYSWPQQWVWKLKYKKVINRVSLSDKRRLIWEGSKGRGNGYKDRKNPFPESSGSTSSIFIHCFWSLLLNAWSIFKWLEWLVCFSVRFSLSHSGTKSDLIGISCGD